MCAKAETVQTILAQPQDWGSSLTDSSSVLTHKTATRVTQNLERKGGIFPVTLYFMFPKQKKNHFWSNKTQILSSVSAEFFLSHSWIKK